MSSLDACVAEIRSTPPLPKFFMESPNWLEHIQAPQKTLSLCCNTEAQSRMILADRRGRIVDYAILGL